MQIWAESGKSALPICNYSQILYQFLTFTQNLKRSRIKHRPLLLYKQRSFTHLSLLKDSLLVEPRYKVSPVFFGVSLPRFSVPL